MSDLKHQTPEQLRHTIAWCERTRAANRRKAADLEAEADNCLRQAADLRKKDHNIGQKECWARIWLARKT